MLLTFVFKIILKIKLLPNQRLTKTIQRFQEVYIKSVQSENRLKSEQLCWLYTVQISVVPDELAKIRFAEGPVGSLLPDIV